MTDPGFSSGTEFLAQAAQKYFKDLYAAPSITSGAAIDSTLAWVPTFHFKIHSHLTILVEASTETPYPIIFKMRRMDVVRIQQPISIYCVCPEEVYLKKQADAKELIKDGYGLLTVESDGAVQLRSSCIPLLQQITREEFKAQIKSLPPALRTRLAECFQHYNNSAPSGAADIAEVMEGLVLRAGRDGVAKNWLANKDVRPGFSADTLKAMQSSKQFGSAAASVGAAQAYISMYRNLSHHFPRDKKQAAQKYGDCKHAFLEGLKKILFFRESMQKIGLSGSI